MRHAARGARLAASACALLPHRTVTQTVTLTTNPNIRSAIRMRD